mgnify:CR=1 FL=1
MKATELYIPEKDLKEVVITLAKIVASIFPNSSQQYIDIQDLLIEMGRWGTPKKPTPVEEGK